MSELIRKSCIPCQGEVLPLKAEQLRLLAEQISGWSVVEEHHLTKVFQFPDFAEALKFVNQVGEIAEREDHHPDICLAWGKVQINIWTHSVRGLTENDFILAAKIDTIPATMLAPGQSDNGQIPSLRGKSTHS
jgi:4a-hydroxytetrahydrobiopterin dehydratase